MTCAEDASCGANVGNKSQKKKAIETCDKTRMFTSHRYPNLVRISIVDSGLPESVCRTAPEYNRSAGFSVLDEVLNADGSYLGELSAFRVETVSVFAKVFKNVTGDLFDGQMPSSDPFNEIVGLDFSLDRPMTLDCRSRKIGITACGGTSLRGTRCLSPPSRRRESVLKIVLDENFPLQLYRRLRLSGYDVEHIVVLGQRGIPDSDHTRASIKRGTDLSHSGL
jgi:hypothetical protein